MRTRLVVLSGLVAVLAVFGACGKEIGDACVIAPDCSPDGDRICDPSSVDGYCTIQGCDVDTCPGESVCVRFFTGGFSNRVCDYNPDDPGPDNPVQCSLDEICAIDNHCVARSAEIRFCMRTCGSNGDCRGDSNEDGRNDYECRNIDLMKAHGGEPVLGPGVVVDDRSPKFCAAAPPPS